MTKYTKAMSQEEMLFELKRLHTDLLYIADKAEAIKKNIEYKYYIEYNSGIKTLEQYNWIPCSERLPNIDEEVIISICDDCADNSYYYTTVGWLCHDTWVSNNERICGEVIAWAPLPKPFKEI